MSAPLPLPVPLDVAALVETIAAEYKRAPWKLYTREYTLERVCMELYGVDWPKAHELAGLYIWERAMRDSEALAKERHAKELERRPDPVKPGERIVGCCGWCGCDFYDYGSWMYHESHAHPDLTQTLRDQL